MSKTKTYSGEDFIKALSENKLSEPVVLEGMAKLGGSEAKSFMFSSGVDCTSWVRIPTDIVENIEFIRMVSCEDHTHQHGRDPGRGDP